MLKYSRTSRYGHLSSTDSFQSPDKVLIFSFKKPLWYELSLIRTTDTKSRPQRVNSYKLIITSLLHTLRWSGESQIPIRWICTGWIQYGCKVISKAQSLHIKQEFAKGVFRNITEFFKAWITTDSIKIFSMAFCALVTVYCTCKTAKDAFRIVLYVTTLYMQHCAAARQL